MREISTLFKVEELFSKSFLKINRNFSENNGSYHLDVFYGIGKTFVWKRECGLVVPFYIDAVGELNEYVDFYKVASYELLWDDLLVACVKTGKPLILSTGMATLDEIRHAVEIIRNNGCKKLNITSLHFSLSTPYNEANLAAIETLRSEFGCKVGWSDHTVDPGVISEQLIDGELK